MSSDLIRQLQHIDPDVRRRAIIALGKSKDPAALKALAAVVKNDPEPTLRELARKAGQYIRQQAASDGEPSRIKPITNGAPSAVLSNDDDDDDLPNTGALLGSP